MSTLTYLTSLVQQAISRLNNYEANAKKVDELPHQTTLEPTSKIPVSRAGNSEHLTVQQIISSIQNSNYNQLLAVGTITVDGTDIIIPSGVSGQINGSIYQTTSDTTIQIRLCPAGFNRKDILVLTTSNTVIAISGEETDGAIVLAPPVPTDALYITEFDVNDTSIGTPIDPSLGTQFKKKSESAAYNDPTLSGSDAVIPLQPNGQSVYAFSNAGLVSIDGFGLDLITGNPSAEVPYPGKDILIYNNKTGNLTLKHDGSGTADVKFLLENGVDLVVPAGGKVWLKYGPSYCEMIFKSWSDVDDVIEGYFNGTNFYTDALFTNLITPESGKIYINIAVTPATQYRWSGSTYMQIGGTVAYEGYDKLSFSHLTIKRTILTSGVWDESIREIGNSITLEDGRILVCYTGTTLPITEGITEFVGLAISNDNGETFTKAGVDGKILTTNSEDPYIIINPINGLLHLYCERKSTTPSFHDGIELFTADVSDLTDWTSQGLVLEKSADSWESRDVSSPTVFFKDGIFYMYYEGRGLTLNLGGNINLATSTDGINFTKNINNPLIYGTEWDNTNPTSGWFTHCVPDDIKVIGKKIYLTTHCYNGKSFVGGVFESEDFINFKDNLNTWVSVSNNNDALGDGLMFYKNKESLTVSNNEIVISELSNSPYSKSIHNFKTTASGVSQIKSGNKNEHITLSITSDTTINFAKQFVNESGVVKTVINPTNYKATINFQDALLNGSSDDLIVLPNQVVVFYCTGLNEWNSYIVQKENYNFLDLNDTLPLTGTTTSTQVYSYIAPANYYKDNSLLDLDAWFEKVGALGVFTVRVFLNSSGIPIITATSSNANRVSTQIIKKLRIKNGNLISRQGGWTDIEETILPISIPFDVSVNNEFKIFVQLANSADSVKMTSFSMQG